MQASKILFALLLVLAVTLGLASCAADEIIDCTDLCETLDDCFDDDVDFFNCVDQCEDEAETTIESCDNCLDDEMGVCMQCSAECDPFTVLL